MTKVADRYGKGKQADPKPPETGGQDAPPAKSAGRVHPEDYLMFWGPHDKGAARPSFCYPERQRVLQAEVDKMEKNLSMGYVDGDRRMVYESKLKAKRDRLDGLNANTERVQGIVGSNKDAWAKRRSDLAETIRNGMPSRKDVEKRRVNPFRVLNAEKGSPGKPGLGALKKEYIVISRALGEESNVSFLQRD